MKWMFIIIMTMLMVSCKSPGNQQTNSNSSLNKNITTSTMKTIIVDVRTLEEWNNDGHADCTVNYPLDQIMSKVDELRKYDSVVLVCRSGNRASHAQSLLRSAGIKNTENKGAWQNIQCR
jgi:phage shock protein E